VIEGLASPDADEAPTADDIRAEAEAAGIDFAAWGAELRGRAEAALRAEERRRARKCRLERAHQG
jgi:hypothetical protein